MKKLKATALGDSITKGVVLTDQDRYTVTQQSFMDISLSCIKVPTQILDNHQKKGLPVI